MLAAQTDLSGTRPKSPPARSRSTFLAARCWRRPKSPPASSRPPIAKPPPADFGVLTARRLVGDAAKIVKERAVAEKAMGKILHTIEDRAQDSTQAADLVRDQNGFARQRDELCRDYAKESLHGYCGLRVTEARVALLQTRLDELGAATAAARQRAKKARRQSRRRAPNSLRAGIFGADLVVSREDVR